MSRCSRWARRETQFIAKAQSGDVDLTPWVGPEMLSLSTGVALTTFELAEAVPSWRSRGEALLEAFAWAPLRVRGTPIGLLCAGRAPGNSGAFSDGERRGLEIFGSRAAAAIDSHSLYDDLQGTFTQTLEGFARALEAKDSLYAWSLRPCCILCPSDLRDAWIARP